MDALTESVLATFDSKPQIVWNLDAADKVEARFDVEDIRVTVQFTSSGENWNISFVTSKERMPLAFQVFSGVFEAVREFLMVRQPEKLVFTTKAEPLGRLYEGYLERKDTELAQMGYEMATVKSTPLAEFIIEKRTPSAWKR